MGDVPIYLREGPDAEFAAREKGAGEGIGWFAAKREDVADGHARGIEAFSFAPCFYLYLKEKSNRINMVIINV